MANRPTLLESLSLCLLAGLAAQSARAQALNDVLARMDQFAPQFSGARAAIRSTNHVQGLPDDDVESGSFLVKRAGDQAQFRIDFAQPNRYSVSVHTQTAEVYHPKINEIQEYDLRAYKDIAQKLFLLGFARPVATWPPITRSAI